MKLIKIISIFYLLTVLEPHKPRTTVTEKLPELPPKNFSEFPPPPANQLWSFKIKPSSLKQPAALEFSQGNESKKVDLDLNGRFASGEGENLS